MIYHLQVDGLEHNEDFPSKPRDDLDRKLNVAVWPVPGGTRTVRPRLVNGWVAPSWWDDDEEASQSFLAAMGVVT